MKSTTHTGFDTDLNGQDMCVEFNRVTSWSSGMEGQDADGNRGVWMTTIDEDYATDIVVLTFHEGPDGHREVSTPLTSLPPDQQVEVQRLVDGYLEENGPEAPEEPDYDYDDVGD